MEKVSPLACSWPLIDSAKKILEEEDHTVNAINALLRNIRNMLHLSGVSIRQRIPRPYSVRVMYEFAKNVPIRRINETITYTESEWMRAMDVYNRGFYEYDSEDGKEPLPGSVSDKNTAAFFQFPYFHNDEFLGTLDLIDYNRHRVIDDRDITILYSLRDLIFRELVRMDDKQSLLTEEDDEGKRDYITHLSRYENFEENLDLILPRYVTENKVLLIVYSDIHYFKLINETYGYRKGDELLRTFARQLKKGTPYVDACRIYSDNFIVAYSIRREKAGAAQQQVEEFQEDMTKALQVCCPDDHLRICSGIYIIEDKNTDASTAIAYANMARKKAKEQNGLHCVQFSPEMIQDIKWQSFLNNELPRAILNHHFIIYYHPKISCDSGRLLGAEALIRWQLEDGSFIFPDQFIPIFEANGNIIKLDYYVYEEVFSYLHDRLKSELPVVPISMNVSRTHLENDDILAYIQFLVEKYNVPAKFIEFELTENIYMNSLESARTFIATCHSMGISVSMDDFGSGYSSLNMITDLDIDVLKIDKIFMRHLELRDNDKIVLNSVIDMAKQLNMIVLCEGVETESQVEFLKYAGCDIIQGYYFARPLSQPDFNDFIMMDHLNNGNEDEML